MNDTTNQDILVNKKLYDFGYFTKADGITSWVSGSLKFGDALAALCYAHGITWDQLVAGWKKVFDFDPNGRGEATDEKLIYAQMAFLVQNATRIPKKILEIGGGRGEVATALKFMNTDIVSVELGDDAQQWYQMSAFQYFGSDFVPVQPVVKPIQEAIHDLDLTTFDTILMIESLEHIPAEKFQPVWDEIVKNFKGRFIVVNWPDYHPIWIGRDASPEDHCRVVDDELYDSWTAQAESCFFRKGSHLVLDF